MIVQERIPAHLPQWSDSFRPSRGRSNRATTLRSLKSVHCILFREEKNDDSYGID